MKTIKFRKVLADRILKGRKNTTWRLFDDKDLSKGDEVELVEWELNKKFANAKLTEVKEKKFKNLTKKDKEEHEKFSSDEEMYQTYTEYYRTEVTPETKLKIIKFKLK